MKAVFSLILLCFSSLFGMQKNDAFFPIPATPLVLKEFNEYICNLKKPSLTYLQNHLEKEKENPNALNNSAENLYSQKEKTHIKLQKAMNDLCATFSYFEGCDNFELKDKLSQEKYNQLINSHHDRLQYTQRLLTEVLAVAYMDDKVLKKKFEKTIALIENKMHNTFSTIATTSLMLREFNDYIGNLKKPSLTYLQHHLEKEKENPNALSNIAENLYSQKEKTHTKLQKALDDLHNSFSYFEGCDNFEFKDKLSQEKYNQLINSHHDRLQYTQMLLTEILAVAYIDDKVAAKKFKKTITRIQNKMHNKSSDQQYL